MFKPERAAFRVPHDKMDFSKLLGAMGGAAQQPVIREMFPLVVVSEDTLDKIYYTTWTSPPKNPDIVSLFAVLKDGKTRLPLLENVSVEVLHTMLENHPSNDRGGESRSYSTSSESGERTDSDDDDEEDNDEDLDGDERAGGDRAGRGDGSAGKSGNKSLRVEEVGQEDGDLM